MVTELPFSYDNVQSWLKEYPTPFYVYDEEGIRQNVRSLQKAFSWNKGFHEYFAVKALPTPAIIRLLASEGCGCDCASIAELTMAERCGVVGDNIMFSSNQTRVSEYQKALEVKAIINLDDISQIEQLERAGSIPKKICLRYNPGKFKEGCNDLYENKFGMPKESLLSALKQLKAKGVESFGIHAMLSGNDLDPDYYPLLAKELFELVVEVKQTLDITISFVDLAGGVGINYKPDDQKIDIGYVGEKIKEVYQQIIEANGLQLDIYTEMGRFITGPYGYLLTQVIGVKKSYKDYIGVDATACDLLRPAMYTAYHHIVVLGKENLPATNKYDVVGSLCENNDKFAIDRLLAKVEYGDILVIEDVGAHSRSMGYNYNGKMRAGEFLMDKDKKLTMIRRRETLEDYFATFDCDQQFTGE